jgi:hypothetical protein
LATALVLGLSAGTMTVASTAGAASPGSRPRVSSGEYPAPCLSSSETSIAPVAAAQVPVEEDAVRALVGARFEGIGQCAHGLLFLMLTPGSEATAQRVRARYGPSVQIMVGFTIWDGKPGRSPTCHALPADAKPQRDITAALHLDATTVASGANLKGHVVFRNVGSSPARVLTVQPISVDLVRPGTRQVVSAYAGAIAGTGYGPLLAPGQTQTVAVVGGTGRCDGGIGSATPPGRYDAVGLVSGPDVTGKPPPGDTLTNLVPVRVVRPR